MPDSIHFLCVRDDDRTSAVGLVVVSAVIRDFDDHPADRIRLLEGQAVYHGPETGDTGEWEDWPAVIDLM
ncbi:hypothetical protein DEQ92_12435 [Haloferax sp. Atlit-6N]|uniref:Uncharacterized protein n=1 Tax=Haloferax gibbonsii (strain ATCC 33959 / DSM 4427 / JCM 8863 / NBRC 102184 / NCIMB 2188 / Ma 2.38) TaxID=1227459 RepID=M0HQ56_HALGM|nr:hypothetical protein C454_01835 [Haloferax gibbonsii ATCC 33959]REA02593.1 hypothetical protein DEQ92_12435 [Haloferax sp. Atlit-6N]